ncbi:ABC transporter ATP-binding protein [Jejuia spongiicola]|uniref:ABC transporter ATP-binding protein/permease n=1 Tax=Jejuia spongiicola TaxID=2942207 RepID=A0ABT0QBT8_9FLAO|nr:ABC transporter ATP-binding protein [Jejuia spongiicola]MCL6294396.1 ABC transporter ATP-binding protein/permease [Jejuia spongiicola]
MNHFINILKYAKPYKSYAIGHIISNVFFALFGTLSFVALKPMLDVIFKKDSVDPCSGEAIAQVVPVEPVYTGLMEIDNYTKDLLAYNMHQFTGGDDSKALIFVVGLIVVMFLLKNIFGYLANYFLVFLRNGVIRDIRNKVYKKTIELPLSYLSEQRKGDILSRVTSDVLDLQYSFLSVLELIVREPLTIIFTITIMLYISPQLTLFIFVFIPIMGFIISKIGKSLKRKSDRVQKEQGVFLSTLEETLTGLRIIKGFNAEDKFNERFQESTTRFYHFSNKLLNRQNLASPSSEFLGICMIAVILWYGGNLVLGGDTTLEGSTFLVYMGLSYNILTPAKAISRALYNIKRGGAAAERIQEIIDTPNPLKDKADAIEKTSFDSEIEFKNVSFKYKDEYVLKDFSLTIPKGKMIAFVGQSGSGKSTIANLITRFYDVNKGEILIDGIDIRELTTSSLRNKLGIVTQDAILFNDSIKNNLKLGNDNINATEDDVIEALKVANAWEFVKDLKGGIDFNIGDSGVNLSGGQKQRLSIARAVLKNPPIMILDEATSALDTESERVVQAALENMMKNRTSIAIAHRLSTIQNADEIVVLKKGEIVEQGQHKDLIAKNGTYKKLVEMQSLE